MTEKNLVLLPGLLCSEALWHRQIEGLRDMAHCLVPDLTQSNTIAGMARSVLKDAPEQFALAGLSMGGLVSFEIMRQSPERVTRLALLDTTPYLDLPERTESRKKQLQMADSGQFQEITSELLIPLLLHPKNQQDPALVEIVVSMAMTVGVEGFRQQIHAIMNRQESTSTLAQITCPTLILCGRQDLLTPLAWHEDMAKRIPNAKLAIIEKCGHLATLEEPEQVTSLLRQWLSS